MNNFFLSQHIFLEENLELLWSPSLGGYSFNSRSSSDPFPRRNSDLEWVGDADSRQGVFPFVKKGELRENNRAGKAVEDKFIYKLKKKLWSINV